MDLPQTLPGVPAAGIDPTVDELATIADLAGVFNWLGSSEGLREAVVQALGGGAPKLRDLVYIRGELWDRMVAAIKVPRESEQPRDLFPIEQGHVAMARRIARLRLGLTAVEVAPSTVAVGGGLGFGGGLPDGPPPPTSATAGEPRLKLSSILDPVLDTELVRLLQAEITKLFAGYEQKRGAEPSEEIEPTVEQISAIAQVLKSDLAPYACFSIFGPHGRRLLQKLMYMSWTYLPNGSWQRRELPGPPSFDFWWASYRVLRTVYLLLGTVAPETLDNYGELIRGFITQYGESVWSIVYNADVRMRAERFQRLRRHAERDHAAARASNHRTTFDIARPWDTVFSMAVADKSWWEENMHRPALLYLARVRTAAQLLDDRTAQPALGASGSQAPLRRPPGDFGQRRLDRSRSSPRDRGQRSRVPLPRPSADRGQLAIEDDGAVYTKKGKRFCDDFNSHQGCSKGKEKCRDLHACKRCKKYGHPMHKCDQGKAGNDKGKDKGGGARRWS